MVCPLLPQLSLLVCPSLLFLWMTGLLTTWIQSTRNLCPCSEGPFHDKITWLHSIQVDTSLPASMWAMTVSSYTLLKCWHRVTLLTMTSCWSVTVEHPGLHSHSHWCLHVGQKVRQNQQQRKSNWIPHFSAPPHWQGSYTTESIESNYWKPFKF